MRKKNEDPRGEGNDDDDGDDDDDDDASKKMHCIKHTTQGYPEGEQIAHTPRERNSSSGPPE